MNKEKLRETARDIMSDIKSAADEGKLTASEIILSYCDIVRLAEGYALEAHERVATVNRGDKKPSDNEVYTHIVGE